MKYIITIFYKKLTKINSDGLRFQRHVIMARVAYGVG
jgi:hypothetical protein